VRGGDVRGQLLEERQREFEPVALFGVDRQVQVGRRGLVDEQGLVDLALAGELDLAAVFEGDLGVDGCGLGWAYQEPRGLCPPRLELSRCLLRTGEWRLSLRAW
jgi:hypothetical protein